MNHEETRQLLAIIAAYDNRKPGEDPRVTINAWQMALGDVPFPEAQAAVIEHFKTSMDWLMPAHIRALVTKARTHNARAVERSTPVDEWIEMPHGFDPDDTGAYARLLAERRSMAARGVRPPTYQLASPAPRPPHVRALPMKEIPDE